MRLLVPSFVSVGFVLAVAAAAVPTLSGCDSSDPVSCDPGGEVAVVETTPAGARLGAEITAADCVYLTYEGRLADGEAFDRGERVPLRIQGTVRGFQQAVVGRRVGESVRVTIPPSLGYGAQRLPPGRLGVEIPACSTLEFDITIGDTAPPSVCLGR